MVRSSGRQGLLAVLVVAFATWWLALEAASFSRAQTADPVIYAAGDIACSPAQRADAARDEQRAGRGKGRKKGLRLDACKDRQTAATIARLSPTAPVLPLGDLQYPNGSIGDFRSQDGYEGGWGTLAARSHPVLGNHEYLLRRSRPPAAGYFEYWIGKVGPGSRDKRPGAVNEGWYAFDLGGWRLYAMNSNCAEPSVRTGISCAAGSPQVQWLRQDMRQNPRRCTLMYMHHPLWASSVEPHDRKRVRDILRPLYRAFWEQGGDVVLAGHAHHYERFAPSTPNQRAPRGARRFRLFVVGTGGYDLRRVRHRRNSRAGIERRSQLADDENFGVLRLRLGDTGYRWNFDVAFTVRNGNRLTDTGSSSCR